MPSNCNRFQLRAVLACFLLGAPGVAAQDAGGARRSTDAAAALLESIPTVFGASRFDQLTTEAPASVTVITAADIAASGWRNLGELLQTVRGFYTINDGVYPSVGVRAFGPPGDYNSRLLLVVDGHRVNENLYDSFGTGFDGMVDLQEVERIEVIRGPASSLYGTSAFFGVLNVVTSRGRALGGVRASIATESYGTREVRLAAGNRLSSGVELYVSATRRRSEGRDYFFADFDSSATRGMASGLDGETRDRVTARLDRGAFSLTGMLNRRSKDYATARYGVDFGVPGNLVMDQMGMLGVGYDRPLTDRASLRVQASWHDYGYHGDYIYSETPSTDWARGQWLVLETQYSATTRAGHRLVFGAQHVSNVRQEQGTREEGILSFYDDSRQAVTAAYATAEYRPRGGWIINGGLRFDQFSTFGHSVNPRVALIRSLGAGSAFKLLYGSAFRAPNNYERLYEGLNIAANPKLGPERIRTVEALLERRLGSVLKLSTSIYRNGVFDLVQDVPTEVTGVQQYRNIGRMHAEGIELEGEFEWRLLRGRATHAWQRGRDDGSGDALPNAPRHLASMNLVVSLPGATTGSLEVRGMSSRRAASGDRVPGYAVSNVWVAIPLQHRRLRLAGGVYNLLGRRYGDPTGNDFVQSTIPQAGRTYRLALEAGAR